MEKHISKQEVVERYQKWYQDNKEEIDESRKRADKTLNDFLDRFGSEEKLRNMDLKRDYAFQTKGSQETFCYKIDFGTDNLGINRCAFQSGYQRYGIQLTIDGKWLPFSKTCDDTELCEQNAKSVFEDYLEKTILLLKATESGDEDTIRSIKMPKPHLNKLHFIFSRGKSINMYVHPDLNKVLSLFNIECPSGADVFTKRKILLKYMEETFEGIDITPWLFCKFIYNSAGLRYLWRESKFKIEVLGENIRKKPVNLNVSVSDANAEKESENDGKKAEDLFYDYLMSNPSDLKIKDVQHIRRIHKNPEQGIHCDFAFETIEGKMMYIEVKSSLKKDKTRPVFL